MARQIGKTLVIRFFIQPTVESWTGDFERVLMLDRIFDIQDQAEPLADRRTIINCHTTRFIDVNPQWGVAPASHFGVNEFQIFPRNDSFNDLADSRIELQMPTPSS